MHFNKYFCYIGIATSLACTQRFNSQHRYHAQIVHSVFFFRNQCFWSFRGVNALKVQSQRKKIGTSDWRPKRQNHDRLSDGHLGFGKWNVLLRAPVTCANVFPLVLYMLCHQSACIRLWWCSTISIKAVHKYSMRPHSICFLLSFLTSMFPELLKLTKAIPVYKSGDCDNIKSYRPNNILGCVIRRLNNLWPSA